MNQKQPENLQQARQQARRRRRRKLMIIRTAIVLAVVLVLLLVGALVVMKIVGTQQSKRGETTTFLAVDSIVVEGDTRYTEEQIIETSGLYVGQSLLGVNKVKAHDALLEGLPYLNTVEISNTKFNVIRIRVTETEVMAAVKLDKKEWMIVGVNNHALERLATDQLPEGVLRVVGATLENEEIGAALMDERSLRITRTLSAAADLYDLTGLTTINMSKKTDVYILINERLKVLLGNETNLTTQVEVLVDTLPTLYRNNGEDASGRVDMLFYSDTDSTNDKVIYTPPEVLDRLNQTQQKPMAAVQMGEEWMTVNAKNVALELLPADYLPADLIQVLGATFEANPAVGKELLDKRSLAICTAVIDGAALHSDVTVAVLDMTDRTAITLRLSTGLRVLFGDSSALSTQMDALAGVLPAVWEEHGEDADGLLDMTSYGDEDDQNDEAVYKRSAN